MARWLCSSSTPDTTRPAFPMAWPTPAQILVRIRADRVFLTDPPPSFYHVWELARDWKRFRSENIHQGRH